MSGKRSKKEMVSNPLSPPKKVKIATNGSKPLIVPRIAPNGYKLPDPIPYGEVVTDSTKNQWIIGTSIGCGGFGEIYAAKPAADKSDQSWNFVIKVDHYHGPLFAEMNFYHRVAKEESIRNWMRDKRLDFLGMPRFIATGIHERAKASVPTKKPVGKNKAQQIPIGICKYRFLVMQRFGDDLQKKLNNFGGKFDLKTSYTIARKVIDILEYIHSFGYIHADTKASNLLLGRSFAPSPRGKGLAEQQGFQSEVWLVDFGLVEKYKDSEGNHKTCEEDMRRANNGTVEFTSRDAHIGALSRRSDLEILAFNILSWLSGGRLPWMGNLKDHKYVHACKKYYMDRLHDLFNYAFASPKTPPPSPPPKEVFDAPEPVLKESERKKEKELVLGSSKSAFDKSRLTVTVPPGIQEFFQYIVKLDFQQDPDYELLKTILQRAIVKTGHHCDGRFSFSIVKEGNNSLKKPNRGNLPLPKGKGRKRTSSESEESEEQEVNNVRGKIRGRDNAVVSKVASKLKKSILIDSSDPIRTRDRSRSVSPDTGDKKRNGRVNGTTTQPRGQSKITDFFPSSPSPPPPVNRHRPTVARISPQVVTSTDDDGDDLVADIVDRVAKGAGRPGFRSPKIVKSKSRNVVDTSPLRNGAGHSRVRMDSSPSTPGPKRHLNTAGRAADGRSKSVSPTRKRSTSVSAPTSIKKVVTPGTPGSTVNGQSSPVARSPFNNPTPAMLELMARLKEKRAKANGLKGAGQARSAAGLKGARAHSPARLFTASPTVNRKVKPQKRSGRPAKSVGRARARSKSPVKSESDTAITPVEEEESEEEEEESEEDEEESEEEEEELVVPAKKAPRSKSKVAAARATIHKPALSSTSSTHSTKENKHSTTVHGTRRSPRVR